MIAIIDYDMGNATSVLNSLGALGINAIISRNASDIEQADRIILPGVGAFSDCMKNLTQYGLVDILENEVLKKKKPFLGICLGMQILATIGREGGSFTGLNWIPGTVERLKVDEKKFRVPHVGWDDVELIKESALFKGVEKPILYFVHSYHLIPENREHVLAEVDYGARMVVAVQKDNIYGVQFHPEKSQQVGLQILSNFSKI